jgi:sulfate adenylyltransferase
VTLLDGDRVRRNLSSGLSFSKQDRETNIERIAWVAAEVARHGGMAVCCPIAPFDRTRKLARQMAEEGGAAFVLVHVSTPIEVCADRDRKGLYARAMRGEIADFTGISSPYEVPEDADLRIDAASEPPSVSLRKLVDFLAARGILPKPT